MNATFLAWLLVSMILACGARQIPEKGNHLHLKEYLNYDDEDTGRHSDRQVGLYNRNRGEGKRSSLSVKGDEDAGGNASVRSNELNDGFDEYPIVTPKRAALLLDRIMVALHHALEDSEEGKGRKINDVYRDGHYYGSGNAAPNKAHEKTPVKEKTFGHGAATGSKSKVIAYRPHKVTDEEVIEAGYEDLPEEFDERSINADEDNLVARDNTMDLQRRGHDASTGSGASAAGSGKGRVYWRCYFNAVTCF